MNPWLRMLEEKITKRFVGLWLCVFALLTAYSYGPPEKFAVFASTIGLMYGVYVGGQTYSDAKQASKP